MSHNHQFIELEDKVVKRYAKTINSVLTGFRLDPRRPENRLDWMLASPRKLFSVVWEDGQQPYVQRNNFSYDDEVIELYSEGEVRLFERLNRDSIESGALKVYTNPAPAVDTTNLLTDEEVDAIATIKQVTKLKKTISDPAFTVQTLKRILERVEAHDRPISVVKAITSRIDELSANN
jgi:hypothetical protein